MLRGFIGSSRSKRGRCAECDYDLRGTGHLPCPECGLLPYREVYHARLHWQVPIACLGLAMTWTLVITIGTLTDGGQRVPPAVMASMQARGIQSTIAPTTIGSLVQYPAQTPSMIGSLVQYPAPSGELDPAAAARLGRLPEDSSLACAGSGNDLLGAAGETAGVIVGDARPADGAVRPTTAAGSESESPAREAWQQAPPRETGGIAGLAGHANSTWREPQSTQAFVRVDPDAESSLTGWPNADTFRTTDPVRGHEKAWLRPRAGTAEATDIKRRRPRGAATIDFGHHWHAPWALTDPGIPIVATRRTQSPRFGNLQTPSASVTTAIMPRHAANAVRVRR